MNAEETSPPVLNLPEPLPPEGKLGRWGLGLAMIPWLMIGLIFVGHFG